MWHIGLISLALALVMMLGACSASSPPANSSTTTPAKSDTKTFGQAANEGKTVFANRCSKCHGDSGQGITAPAVIGSSANLGKYNTAQGLLNFIDVSMPFDAPGSLSSQDYLNVLSFLLVQNNYVDAGTALDQNQLGNIQLKK